MYTHELDMPLIFHKHRNATMIDLIQLPSFECSTHDPPAAVLHTVDPVYTILVRTGSSFEGRQRARPVRHEVLWGPLHDGT